MATPLLPHVWRHPMEEHNVWIIQYATPELPGFSAILKHRYRDFQVSEVDLAGREAKLTCLEPPAQPQPLALSQLTQATITSAVAAFSALAGPSNAARLEALLQKVFSTHVAPQQQAAGVPISAQQQPATAQSGGATTAAAEAAQGTGGATSLAAGAQAEAGTDAALATGGQEGSAVEVVEEAGGVLSVELEPISDKEARKEVHDFFRANPGLIRLETMTGARVDARQQQQQQQQEQEQKLEQGGRGSNKRQKTGRGGQQGPKQQQQQGQGAGCIRVYFTPQSGATPGSDGSAPAGAGGEGGDALQADSTAAEGAGGGRGGGRGQGRRGGRGQGGRGRGGRGQGGQGGGDGDGEPEWGGGPGNNFIKFVLCKENLDTQVALQTLARGLRLGPWARPWGFAGTKDKRGVTQQFVTAFKIHPARLAALNGQPWMRGLRVGNFEYVPEALELGRLAGNRFQLLMRACQPLAPEGTASGTAMDEDSAEELEEELSSACKAVKANGFINYFGLQRFGTAGTPTQLIGAALLRGEYARAIDMIMAEGEFDNKQGGQASAGGAPQEGRQQQKPEVEKARRLWAQTRDAQAVLRGLPGWMVAEHSLMQALSRNPVYKRALQSHRQGKEQQGTKPQEMSQQQQQQQQQDTDQDASRPAAKRQKQEQPIEGTPEAVPAPVSAMEGAEKQGQEVQATGEAQHQVGAEGASAAGEAKHEVGSGNPSTPASTGDAAMVVPEAVAADALVNMPRTVRQLYLHAWQSRLWNAAASHRVAHWGAKKVVAGDLVLPRPGTAPVRGSGAGKAAAASAAAAGSAAGAADEFQSLVALAGEGGGDGEDGEGEGGPGGEAVQQGGGSGTGEGASGTNAVQGADQGASASATGAMEVDGATGAQGEAGDGARGTKRTRQEEGGTADGTAVRAAGGTPGASRGRLRDVKVVTEFEADAGVYCIEDVVLPLPGTYVQYPKHVTADLYKQMAKKEGIDLDKLGRAGKGTGVLPQYEHLTHLTGDYRRLIMRPRGFAYKVLRYSNPDDDTLAPTPLERLGKATGKAAPQSLHPSAPPAPASAAAAGAGAELVGSAAAGSAANPDASSAPAPAAPGAQAGSTEPAGTKSAAAGPVVAPPGSGTEPAVASAVVTTSPPSGPPDVWDPTFKGPGGPLVGLLLSFMLPSSSYATMLIREITRSSTSRAAHAALTGQQNLLRQQQQEQQEQRGDGQAA